MQRSSHTLVGFCFICCFDWVRVNTANEEQEHFPIEQNFLMARAHKSLTFYIKVLKTMGEKCTLSTAIADFHNENSQWADFFPQSLSNVDEEVFYSLWGGLEQFR